MKIEELHLEWENDCKIDKNLDQASVLIPHLHSKYVALWSTAKLKLAKEKKERNILKRNKFKYYRGELSKEELTSLGWEQFQLRKVLKGEMENVLDGDPDIANQELKVEYLETMVGFLDQVLAELKSRTWDIKNAIEYKKFIAGM